MTIMGAQDDEFPMNWGRIPSLFTQRRRKRNSRKFKVASTLSDAAASTRQQHGGTP